MSLLVVALLVVAALAQEAPCRVRRDGDLLSGRCTQQNRCLQTTPLDEPDRKRWATVAIRLPTNDEWVPNYNEKGIKQVVSPSAGCNAGAGFKCCLNVFNPPPATTTPLPVTPVPTNTP